MLKATDETIRTYNSTKKKIFSWLESTLDAYNFKLLYN